MVKEESFLEKEIYGLEFVIVFFIVLSLNFILFILSGAIIYMIITEGPIFFLPIGILSILGSFYVLLISRLAWGGILYD